MEYFALVIAVFFGGIVCGFAGFAFSAVAGAILLHVFEPMQAIPLMMCCSIASQITSLTVLGRLVRWHEITPLMIGGLVGVPIAIHLLTVVDSQTFRTGFGVFLATYASYMLVRRPGALLLSPPGIASRSVVGFAGGLVGGLTAMPGAVLTIWCDLQGFTKEQQRALVQPFILGMQLFGLAVVLLMTPVAFDRTLPTMIIMAIPILAVGTYIGIKLFGRINDHQFRFAVLALLFISGCLMLPFQALASLFR